tara:strand:+ start:329 stop:757 length:429 start_codon:yes stop_codon:yes gene_type:complete
MTAGISEQLLNKQLEQLSELETLLKEEREVLTKQDPKALLALTEQKEQLLISIENFDKTIGNNQQFLADKQQGLVDAQLEEVKALLMRCQELNEVNGQIINHSQVAVERVKTRLLERHSKNSMTYDAKGKKSAGLSSIGIKA